MGPDELSGLGSYDELRAVVTNTLQFAVVRLEKHSTEKRDVKS